MSQDNRLNLVCTAVQSALVAAEARAQAWRAENAKQEHAGQGQADEVVSKPPSDAPPHGQPNIVERDGMWFAESPWPISIDINDELLSVQFPYLQTTYKDSRTDSEVLVFHTENARAEYRVNGLLADLVDGSTYTP